MRRRPKYAQDMLLPGLNMVFSLLAASRAACTRVARRSQASRTWAWAWSRPRLVKALLVCIDRNLLSSRQSNEKIPENSALRSWPGLVWRRFDLKTFGLKLREPPAGLRERRSERDLACPFCRPAMSSQAVENAQFAPGNGALGRRAWRDQQGPRFWLFAFPQGSTAWTSRNGSRPEMSSQALENPRFEPANGALRSGRPRNRWASRLWGSCSPFRSRRRRPSRGAPPGNVIATPWKH